MPDIVFLIHYINEKKQTYLYVHLYDFFQHPLLPKVETNILTIKPKYTKL